MGKAHVALTRLLYDTTQAYEAIKKALRERFEPSSKQEVYKVEFENRRKQKTESWGAFGGKLLHLVDKRFPTCSLKGKNS